MKKLLPKKFSKKIKNAEEKFEKLPKTLQVLVFLYTVLVAIIFGIVLGVIINCQNLREMKNSQLEKIRLEQNSINSILKKIDKK